MQIDTNDACSVGVRDEVLLSPKLGQLLCLRTRVGFGGKATEQFHFRKIETKDMLVYQSNPLGVEFFSYVHTSVGFMLHYLRTEI